MVKYVQMTLISRYITQDIIEHIQPNKVVVIYGPRQVGKTTLLNQVLAIMGKPNVRMITGDDLDAQKWLSSQRLTDLRGYIGSSRFIVIDEAQKIPKIGINLKLLVDHFDEIQIIATGSSSFELAGQIGEPLVGRKWEYTLYPIAQLELGEEGSIVQAKALLPSRLIFGSYPKVVITDGFQEKRQILSSIVDNFLFRDILALKEIRKPAKLLDLLKLLAFQIGSEVSLRELSSSLSISLETVERYLDLLEKVFIVRRVFGFSRNLRKEVTKSSKWYFLDNGVRNAVINNFNDLDTRDDVGQLWENYLFTERLKKRSYTNLFSNEYFWRTYDQKEIDLIEEREGKLFGYEFKWRNKRSKAPKDWLETYDNASYEVIGQDNYLEFIT